LVQTFRSGQPDNQNATLPFYIILPLPSQSDNQNQNVIPKSVDEQPIAVRIINRERRPPNNDRNINKTNLKVIKLFNEQSSSRLCLPKLMITNARSLLNKHDEAYSVTVANGVDLFAVTETWLHSQVPDEVISMPSFQLIRKDRINDRRGGGVCRYVKDYINCIHLTELENDHFEVL
jgi:hypothetical protein